MNKKNFDILEALYNGSIRYLDYIIQDILNFLENDLDNSIVIITSDHGENIGDHHLMGHYYGLQETLIHIPLIMKLPGQTGGQKTVSRLVQLVDIFPTVMEILGHEAAGLREQFQGSSLLSDHGRAYAIAELLAPSPPVETLARWASVVPDSLRSQYERRLRAIRGPRFKYVWASDEQEELYDVVADPDESRNLVDEMESTLAEFRHYRQGEHSVILTLPLAAVGIV